MGQPSPDAPRCVVLSPHLDDAVLSAWHILSSSTAVQVVTVFAGIPEPGFVTSIDRLHGALESAAWMRRRRADDAAALALAGRAPCHLDLLDVQYRAYGVPRLRAAIERHPEGFMPLLAAERAADPAADRLAADLGRLAAPGTVLYAPAGIGGHPDHRAVGRAALGLAAAGCEVRLYADTPYWYARHGPPSWVRGAPNQAADAAVEEALAHLPVDPDRLDRHLVELTPGQVAGKTAAVERYTTELGWLRPTLSTPPCDPGLLGYEAWWTVAAP